MAALASSSGTSLSSSFLRSSAWECSRRANMATAMASALGRLRFLAGHSDRSRGSPKRRSSPGGASACRAVRPQLPGFFRWESLEGGTATSASEVLARASTAMGSRGLRFTWRAYPRNRSAFNPAVVS